MSMTRGILRKPTPGVVAVLPCAVDPQGEASIIFGRLLASPNRAGASLLLPATQGISGGAGTGGRADLWSSQLRLPFVSCLIFTIT